MNAIFEKTIRNATVRLKAGNDIIGTGIIVQIDGDNYGLLCLKHCIFEKLDSPKGEYKHLINILQFEYWDNSMVSFVDSGVVVKVDSSLQYLNEDDDEILLFKIPGGQITSNFTQNFKFSEHPPYNTKNFWTYGYPKGNGYTPTSIELNYNTIRKNYIIMGVNPSSIESNDSLLQENSKGFSGSGVWFELDHQFYLLGLFKGSNSDIPLIRVLPLSNNLFKDSCVKLRDFSRPINEFVETRKLSISSTAAILNYQNEYVSFEGREEQLKKLDELIKHESSARWINISGQGGIGKNRLVLEFSKSINEKGWEIQKIDELKAFEKIISFPFNHNTLFVMDYEKLYAELRSTNRKCGYLVNELEKLLKRECSYSIRVIVISRVFDKEFEDSISSNLFVSEIKEEEIILKKLLDSEYLSIVRDVVKKEGKHIDISDDAILQVSKKVDTVRTPLFAQVFAFALIEKVPMSNWAENDLLNYLYNKERSKLREKFTEIDFGRHLNLVGILLTINRPSMKFLRCLTQEAFLFLPNTGYTNSDFIDCFFEIKNNELIPKFPDLVRVFFAKEILNDINNESMNFDGNIEISSLFSFILDFKENENPDNAVSSESINLLKKIDVEVDESHNLLYFLIHLLQSYPESNVCRSLALFYQDSITIKDFSIPSIVLGIIIDIFEGLSNPTTSKIQAFSILIELLEEKLSSYSDKINLCRFYTHKILFEQNELESYAKIKKISDYFFKNPNQVMVPTSNKELERLYCIAEEGKNPFDYAKPPIFVIWEGVQLYEANALQLLLKKGENEELCKRFDYIIENCGDPRIYNRYVDFILTNNLNYKLKDKIEKLKFVLNRIIVTREQMAEINTEEEVINSSFKAFYFLVNNGAEPVFLQYLQLLKSKIVSIENYEKMKYFSNQLNYRAKRLVNNMSIFLIMMTHNILK